ncbi:RNA polymerase sigma-70 factor, ECF subfamily [Solimonas aquatica]|uniref:RNA polymerase sigma-70 factor, ECF subfamily n=1 Tax=Solimonas aquatica TaxID=489703 RepID=A0A1H9F5L3_9GAMM|nr:sigma-70 family RNA polymerase sigma factor [Solimonas aquatica]SEQ33167.1 RNA polymerase sigma-70 factor, ECF subfamily [Solimonas aquatica]
MADAAALMQMLSDTASGNQRAFRSLYEATSPHLYAVLIRILQRRDWAEEALQDCYLKVWQKAESYAPDKGAPLTWLQTIARYRALDLLRMKRPETELPEEDEAPPMTFAAGEALDPELRATEREGIAALQRCMENLGGEQRQSVLLAYYEGYTHQELSQRLKKPLGTVKSWVRRGLQQLRECLDA